LQVAQAEPQNRGVARFPACGLTCVGPDPRKRRFKRFTCSTEGPSGVVLTARKDLSG